MRVKQKLIAYAGLVSCALLILGIIFFVLSQSVQTKLMQASALSQQAVASSDDVQATITNSQTELNTMAIKLSDVTEPLNLNKQRLAILDRKSGAVINRITELIETLLLATDLLDEDSDVLFEIEDAIYELEDIQGELRRELQANIQTTATANNSVANDVINGANDLTKLNQDFQNAFDSLIAVNVSNTENNQNAISKIKNAEQENKHAKIITMITIVIIALIVIGVVVYTIILVTKPLDSLSQGIEKVAGGDFTTVFLSIRKDEFGDVSDAMNTMVSTIKQTIEDISQEASVLLDTASSMEENSMATKRAIEKEQDEVTSVVCATEQMLQTVKSVTIASHESLDSSQASNEASKNGVKIVKENIRKVNQLATEFNKAASVVSNVQTHTEEIHKILEVIKDITEQTNLLALNAAIEAARAGEQGRGFAVVADEVRQLALRTQNSTTQITDIIQGLIASSENAVALMKNSEHGVIETSEEAAKINRVFETISEKVADIQIRIDTVASASEEQSQVSQDVQKRMQNIDSETRNVYNMANDVVTKSSSLKQVSERIARQLNQFII
ncbi:MAG: methyl-accepting chemotaxis protein [Glaciecola sp.]